MRDLVEAAIGSHGPIETEPGEQGEETAFGDPTVALVGCGPAGRRRLDGARDAVPGVLQDAGGTDLERIAVTTGPLSAPDSEVDAVFDLVEGVEPTARRPPHLAGAERIRNNRERIEPLLDDVDVCLVTAGCSGMGPGLAGAMAEVAAETGTSAVTVPTVPADPSPRSTPC